MRFFSPPEKPSLTLRSRNLGSILTSAHFSAAVMRNVSGSSSSSPFALRFSLTMRRRKSEFETPGSSTGYWNARKTPARAAWTGSIASRSSPSSVTAPPVTSYAGWRASTFESVDLPEPFGPMIACTSPLRTVRSSPFRISTIEPPPGPPLLSTCAHTPSTSSSGASSPPSAAAARTVVCGAAALRHAPREATNPSRGARPSAAAVRATAYNARRSGDLR